MSVRTRSFVAFAAIAALGVGWVAGPVSAQDPPSPSPGSEPLPEGVVADRYDIGGRALFMACVGPTDSELPTVIGESGLGGGAGAFGPLVPLLAAAPFRSCAYDRAGLGNSDPPPDAAEPGPGPVTLQDGAEDLHALLAAAELEPPYVLLAWSIGGWYARVFTQRYPEEVAGIVFIDSSHPEQVARFGAILPPERPDEDERVAAARKGNREFLSLPPSADTGWLDLAASAEQAGGSGDLGDRPEVVLTAGRWMTELPEPYATREAAAWRAMQYELASLSSRGVQRTVEGAGHAIAEDRPEAIAQAIMDVQAAIASGPGSWPGGSPAPEPSPSAGG